MSDNEGSAARSPMKDESMSAQELAFIIACLKNTTGGSITVNQEAVAEELGYKNVRSVANRMAQVKKKWGIPLGGKALKESETKPSGPKTPTTNRVTKRKIPTKNKTPAKKAKNEASDDELVEAEDNTTIAKMKQEEFKTEAGMTFNDVNLGEYEAYFGPESESEDEDTVAA
ncbi:hypothetical protein BGZ60DRAFT_434803 [Tricladium varicosporioides]|nr:hypothetical protein BGZ60DRAFT_434803 [Hymenoscyphus varicosporioides]